VYTALLAHEKAGGDSQVSCPVARLQFHTAPLLRQ
jgi:hypothetical protein